MTARPQSPALTPAIEALVEKAARYFAHPNAPSAGALHQLRTLALAVAEAAAREERERAAKIAEQATGPDGVTLAIAILIARAIRGGADAESE